MQTLAQASQWANHTTRSSEVTIPIGSPVLHVRMRVQVDALGGNTAVTVQVSSDGEGWQTVRSYEVVGVPTFLGFGGSCAQGSESAPGQSGIYAIDYIRVFEDPPNLEAQLTTSGGSQQLG